MWARLASIAIAILPLTDVAHSAEIRGLFAAGVGVVTRELTPAFEAAANHKVSVTYGVVGTLNGLLQRGEIADVIIAPPAFLDSLYKQGKVVTEKHVPIAKTGIGVAIRAGASKPKVDSVDALKLALTSARAFGFVDPSGGAAPSVPIANMLGRIGIIPQSMTSAKFFPNGRSLFEAIAKQEADIGVYITNEIVTTPGIELAGPVPAELQFYIPYSAAILSGAPEPNAARQLIEFLSSPTAIPIIQAKGMEPG